MAGTILNASVFSAPITLPGGPLFFEFLTKEQYSPSNDINNTANLARVVGAPPEGNWGVALITTISVGTIVPPQGSQITGPGPTIFSSGQNGGQQILGIFHAVVNNPGGPPFASTGGVLDLYFWDNNNQAITPPFMNADLSKRGTGGSQNGNAEGAYLGFTCPPSTPGCTFLARFDFTPGADVSTAVNTNTIFTAAGSSTSETYLSVDTSTQGAWTDLLDSNFFTLNPNQQPCGSGVACIRPNDLRLDATFTPNVAGGWDVAGTDIIGLWKHGAFRAFVVPEPGTLALFGIGLAVACIVGVYRRAKSQSKTLQKEVWDQVSR